MGNRSAPGEAPEVSRRLAAYRDYPPERLAFAVAETRRRLALAHDSLARALADSQQADTRVVRVRRKLKQLEGEARLVEALLKSEESFFEGEEGDPGSREEEEKLGESVITMLRPAAPRPGGLP